MTVKETLHAIVEDLDEERATEALAYLSELAGDLTSARAENAKWRQGPRIMSARDFFAQPAVDWRTLAAQQGVEPIGDPTDLAGDFWPEDETADEFVAAVREWRREGRCD